MAGMSNMHGTTWAYGQPFPFLDFYDSGGWSLWPRVWKFRVAVDIVFWSVLLEGLALTCSWLHERFGERFSTRQAFFGFVFTLATGFQWGYDSLLLGVTAVVFAVTLWQFQRRDIGV